MSILAIVLFVLYAYFLPDTEKQVLIQEINVSRGYRMDILGHILFNKLNYFQTLFFRMLDIFIQFVFGGGILT